VISKIYSMFWDKWNRKKSCVNKINNNKPLFFVWKLKLEIEYKETNKKSLTFLFLYTQNLSA
jgi:hypothetical protein